MNIQAMPGPSSPPGHVSIARLAGSRRRNCTVTTIHDAGWKPPCSKKLTAITTIVSSVSRADATTRCTWGDSERPRRPAPGNHRHMKARATALPRPATHSHVRNVKANFGRQFILGKAANRPAFRIAPAKNATSCAVLGISPVSSESGMSANAMRLPGNRRRRPASRVGNAGIKSPAASGSMAAQSTPTT